jgi:hypothetical protein
VVKFSPPRIDYGAWLGRSVMAAERLKKLPGMDAVPLAAALHNSGRTNAHTGATLGVLVTLCRRSWAAGGAGLPQARRRSMN